MIGPVRTWYAGWFGGLTTRERGLVTVAAGLALVVVLVFGLILPLGRAHDAAHVRHRQAIESSSRLLAQLAALEAPATRRATLVGPVSQMVAASADSAGFVLQSNQPRGAEATLIVVPTARPSAALAWLDTLAAQGIVLEGLTMTPAADGSVSVNASLRRVAT
jgi:general secretion pathway protein M